MTIAVGDRLPEGVLTRIGKDGPEDVKVSDLTRGRNVVIFGVPGAFTPTCHSSHMPSFVRSHAQFAKKGVDEVICVATNDPFVLQAWGEATGAAKAQIAVLSDSLGAFSKAMGLAVEQPGSWVNGRSKRYAMYVVDGVVKVFHPEPDLGCTVSGGESLLAAI